MTRNSFTERYLQEMGAEGINMPALAQSDGDLDATSYRGRCLSRPVFLSAVEREQIEADLSNLHSALIALPDRLFGGDLGAFARAAGMTDDQVTAILRTRSQAPTRLARADVYHDGNAFRLMEFNMGSALGGFDNAMLNRILLTDPMVASFVAAHGLAYVDTLAELAQMLLAASGVPDGVRPVVAVVDWPASFVSLEARLRASAAELAPLGIEAIPCHLGQLEFHDGRVWVEGRPADLVYRLFMVEDLLDPAAPALVDPVLRAAERGEVKIFVPMDAELYGSKAALAMLSDEAHRHLLTPAELESLDRLLPWTRMARDGAVTVDSERVDLLEYAVEEREDLVLKPTLLHGGIGVVLGWQVEPDEWRSQVKAALGGAYVVQRRIRGVPELFPGANGLEPWLLRWGVFLMDNGYGGAVVGGTTDLSGGALATAGNATVGCCFHEAGPRAN